MRSRTSENQEEKIFRKAFTCARREVKNPRDKKVEVFRSFTSICLDFGG
jgi:hypothetical protein